jgi:hypothetical protein
MVDGTEQKLGSNSPRAHRVESCSHAPCNAYALHLCKRRSASISVDFVRLWFTGPLGCLQPPVPVVNHSNQRQITARTAGACRKEQPMTSLLGCVPLSFAKPVVYSLSCSKLYRDLTSTAATGTSDHCHTSWSRCSFIPRPYRYASSSRSSRSHTFEGNPHGYHRRERAGLVESRSQHATAATCPPRTILELLVLASRNGL